MPRLVRDGNHDTAGTNELVRRRPGAAFGLGRIGEPADTAGVVAFLVSDDAAFVTEQEETGPMVLV